MTTATASHLDEALVRLHTFAPEYWGGLANHGPMAVEALAHLGAAAAIPAWLRRYERRLEPAPLLTATLDGGSWRAALGDAKVYPAWRELLCRELNEEPWTAVARRWVTRLLPGYPSAAAHGVIRTAHAVRALETVVSEPRLDELAHALAYWASTYEELPLPVPTPSGSALVAEALRRVGAVGVETGGFISTALALAAAHPDVGAAVDGVAPADDADRALGELTAASAALYLANASRDALALVHAVTGPSAVRMLLPVLDDDARARAFAYAWQTAVVFAGAYAYEAPRRVEAAPEAADLVGRAVVNGDEHVIKMVAACHTEHARTPDPVYLAAAADVLTRL